MRRKRLALAAVLTLAACGREADLGPALDTRPPAALAQRFYPPDGWTWGLLQIGEHPPHRYGVAGPRGPSRGDLVIVPGFSEPAEKWFETAGDLIDRGWTVWILDLAGQGGSARTVGPRDKAHVRDMMVDVEALRGLVADVMQPADSDRVVVLAHSLGAATALIATSRPPRPLAVDTPPFTGVAGVDALILSAPTVRIHPQRLSVPEGRLEAVAVWARRLGLGHLYAWGQDGWSSTEVTDPPVTHDGERGRVQTEWMRANPMLRVGGVSWAHAAAFLEQTRWARVLAPEFVPPTPVLVIAPTEDAWAAPGSAAALCRALPRCTFTPLPGSRHEPHMEVDAVRDRWLAIVLQSADGQPLSPASPAR